MKKLTIILVSALMVLSFATVSLQFAPEVLAGSAADEICQGIGAASPDGECGNAGDLNRVVQNVINIFSLVVGIVAVVMIMVAGFKYITAGGESSSITSAKHTLLYAIIGLVIVAFSQLIVQFVLDTV